MAATAGEGIDVGFFTWPTAFFRQYDIFHLHWPELLVSPGNSFRAKISRLRAKLLLFRLRLTRTPIVRTLHNIRPHDAADDPHWERAIIAFERQTAHEIHLVPEPGRVVSIPTTEIPHGSYHVPYAQHARRERVAGRVIFFGLIRPYKGVDTLIEQFRRVEDPSASLRIVGRPMDPSLAAFIERAAEEDPRITLRFGFIPDADLVDELTSAELVVLPYRELHSSGAALVALSLDRPLLVPETSTTTALQNEVGTGWVHLFTPPLEADDIERALAAAKDLTAGSTPDLSAREWPEVQRKHAIVYRSVLRGNGVGGSAE
ncbi:glycosyltransferase [Microbacterium paludicola]|uniref:glycosyltransferase n=1 Tax=Microbacterium paludicola TaxID=300019 RepID=UPI0031E0DFC7